MFDVLFLRSSVLITSFNFSSCHYGLRSFDFLSFRFLMMNLLLSLLNFYWSLSFYGGLELLSILSQLFIS